MFDQDDLQPNAAEAFPPEQATHSLPKHPVQQWSNLAQEYIRLTTLPTLTNKQADRVDRILALAEYQPWLNFLIQEIDYEVGRRSGLINLDKLEAYLDQQAILSEFYGENLEHVVVQWMMR